MVSALRNRFPLSAWLFILWLCVFTLFAFLIILGMSVVERSPLGQLSLHLTLQNYSRCFQWLYAKVFWKTAWMAGAATISCVLIGFPIAYFLARAAGRQKQMGLILLFVPFWTNFILRVHGLTSLFGHRGLLNQLLLDFKLISSPLEVLYTRWGVFLGMVYNYLPFAIVPMFSALEKLDASLIEAAGDLGANRRQTFLKVIIPNVQTGIAVGALFVFIPMLGEYVIPDILGGGKEAYLGNLLVNQFFVMQDWPFGSAIAGILSLGLLMGLWLQHRWQMRRT